MIRHHGNRARLGGVLLVVALGAAAIMALPGVALTKDRDGDHPRAAGTIESFDPETHLLTIDLTDAGTVEGLVVRRTRIRCGDVSRGHRQRRRARRHGNRQLRRAAVSRRGDRGDTPGELEPGDDRGREDEPGDDRGGDGGERRVREDEGDDHRRGRHRGDSRCVDALVEGATVMRAEMVLAHGKAFYKNIGVLPPPAAETE